MASSHLEALRGLVTSTLESAGVLSRVRAQLRHAVCSAVHDQTSSTPHPLTAKPFHLFEDEEKLLSWLVLDFFDALSLDFSPLTFLSETGQQSQARMTRAELHERVAARSSSSIQWNQHEPLLLQVLKRGLDHGAVKTSMAVIPPANLERGVIETSQNELWSSNSSSKQTKAFAEVEESKEQENHSDNDDDFVQLSRRRDGMDPIINRKAIESSSFSNQSPVFFKPRDSIEVGKWKSSSWESKENEEVEEKIVEEEIEQNDEEVEIEVNEDDNSLTVQSPMASQVKPSTHKNPLNASPIASSSLSSLSVVSTDALYTHSLHSQSQDTTFDEEFYESPSNDEPVASTHLSSPVTNTLRDPASHSMISPLSSLSFLPDLKPKSVLQSLASLSSMPKSSVAPTDNQNEIILSSENAEDSYDFEEETEKAEFFSKNVTLSSRTSQSIEEAKHAEPLHPLVALADSTIATANPAYHNEDIEIEEEIEEAIEEELEIEADEDF